MLHALMAPDYAGTLLQAVTDISSKRKWANVMATVKTKWCHQRSAQNHLKQLLQDLHTLRALSQDQIITVHTAYTVLLVRQTHICCSAAT